jgi:NAD(P)-dependent dehydrogenase (short-subunit alcohol dehydrogenase family)
MFESIVCTRGVPSTMMEERMTSTTVGVDREAAPHADPRRQPEILTGRVFAVTGATSGIGSAIARGLVRRGASVIVVGRSERKCDDTVALLARYGNDDQAIRVARADLASLDEVRELARRIGRVLDELGAPHLDGLVNNAGAVSGWHTTTVDGFELQFAVNHLAPFLLTQLLLPRLLAATNARVITTTSGSHRQGRIHWNDLQLRRRYNPIRAYAQSKLANLLTTYELARVLGPDSGVTVAAADPGLVNTAIGEKGTTGIAKWIWERRRHHGAPPNVGAACALHVASAPDHSLKSGLYWYRCEPQTSSRASRDEAAAGRLWELSMRMVGLE